MRWLSRARQSADEGFGLIEMVVALLIAGLVFGALATTLIASLRTSLLSRQNQQAADLATQAIEDMRLQDFGSLSVDPSLYSGGPLGLASCAGTVGVVGLPGSGGSCLPLVTPAGGTPAGVKAKSTLAGNDGTGNADTNNTVYTLYRYVTQVSGQPLSAVRHVTVYVQWTLNGSTHTRSSSTDISYSQRGLPLPYFALKPGTSTQTINPNGARAVHAFTLANKGAPDHWNLILTGFTAGMKLFADTDGDGLFTPGTDQALTDTTGDGVVDTGRVDPGTTFHFFLVLDTNSNPTAVGNYITSLTARSVAQPSLPSSAQTATATTIVQSGVIIPPPSPSPTPTPSGTPPPGADPICSLASVTWPAAVPGYSTRAFVLHNNGLSTSTTQPQLNLDTNAPAFTALGVYSSDAAPGVAGRLVTSTGSGSGNALRALSSATTYLDWDADLSKQSVAGGVLLHLWVATGTTASPVPAGASIQATVYVTKNNGSLQQDLGYVSAPITSGCVGFQEIAVIVPTISPSPYSISNNNQIHVRVGITSSSPLRFGYDTSAMPAALGLAVG